MKDREYFLFCITFHYFFLHCLLQPRGFGKVLTTSRPPSSHSLSISSLNPFKKKSLISFLGQNSSPFFFAFLQKNKRHRFPSAPYRYRNLLSSTYAVNTIISSATQSHPVPEFTYSFAVPELFLPPETVQHIDWFHPLTSDTPSDSADKHTTLSPLFPKCVE